MNRKRIRNFKNEKLFYATISLCLLSALVLAGINMYTASDQPSDGYYVDLSQLEDGESAGGTEEMEDVGRETTANQVQADNYQEDELFGLDNVMDATDEVDEALMKEREAILEGGADAAGQDSGAEADVASSAEADAAEADSQGGQEDLSQVEAAEAMTGADAAYTEGTPLKWPVAGNVLLNYSMDKTIYFPTLKQYKYNPGIVISSQVDMPVTASHGGEIVEISQNEELGNYVRINVGNDFQTVYGQLKDIPYQVGDRVEEGAVIGYISEPTKYYSQEGPHLYFEMHQGNNTINPLDYLE